MRNSRISVEPIAGALGAEVYGIDLSRDLDATEFQAVHDALMAHGVVFFRDQDITPHQQLAFARRFGDIHFHPFVAGLPDLPEVMEIVKTETDVRNFGEGWHTDQMFLPEPAMGTILYAKEIPDFGGDTLYASMYAAYDGLSEGMKALAGRLRTVNLPDAGRPRGRPHAATYSNLKTMGLDDKETYAKVSEHPLVRTHPVTGRKALYIGLHTEQFAGMSYDESQGLLNHLIAHATRPEYTCRFRWRLGSLALWDNRCVLHNAINDYPGKRRRMHRVTVKGDAPFH
jgi:taurine dioxygenase